ncbi:tryptophan 7-halogenase [Brevundimonas sp.]|uniref:tryptophan 7-halogenase n=1 Tax=Brevundimonas sp. TaxID=1871086 RepID=UPI003D12D90D
MGRPVSRIVMVGAGVDAWLSALGLARAVAALGVQIEVLETPNDPTPIALDVLPAVKALHRILGVDEREIVRSCAAVPVAGQRFSDWTEGEGFFVHAYAQVGETASHMDFLQHWLRARGRGMPARFSDFSRGGAAVIKRRAPPLRGDWVGADYGYHLDGAAYVDLLRRKALALGVTTRPVQQVAVVWEGGRIVRLDLGESGEAQADLYIDATGAEAKLIGEAGPWEDGSAWFPFRRLATFVAPRAGPLEAVTDVLAWAAGWVCVVDLQDRRVLQCAFDETVAGIDAVEARMAELIGAPVQRVSDQALTPGLRQGWIGNCVALGRSGVRADMLDGGWLHGLQVGLTHLVTLFPTDDDMAAEARAFNAAVRRHAEALRDFQAAHYRLAKRPEPSWRAAADVAPPASLAERLELFALRGALGMFEDETFQADNWRMMLLGHGLIPTDPDPGAAALDDSVELPRLHGFMQSLINEVGALPTVEAWIDARRAA